MKIAIVYNRESKSVINLFGMANQEKIGKKTIARITDALKGAGHQVTAFEGDKDLVDRLEEFMPRVIKGERPGMVFNVSYGIQGQARYTHVPSILEMVGVPYVASGPLAHSLSLDKVVTKMILKQHGLPTPDFAVLSSPDTEVPDLHYPLIVKPKNEAVSFGIRIVNNPDELHEGARIIFEKFGQAVLVEQYIEGREINVGLLGNNPPEALPPVELVFGTEGPKIYTYEDKKGSSGRTISHACPAPIGDALLEKAKSLAVQAFEALGCCDCARVDMRLDGEGRLYILETNSLPSLGEHGSYLVGAAAVGLDFAGTVNRLVEVASARYFGTPEPPALEREKPEPAAQIFSFITQRRDTIERRLKDWIAVSSRTGDPVGAEEALRKADRLFRDLRMQPVEDLSDERSARTWATQAGMEGGTLFIGALDVPGQESLPHQQFRREPEWVYGDGIATSRAPLVMLEFALRAVRSVRRLRKEKIGVLLYADEGRAARYSASLIRKAAARAGRVLVLRPGGPDHAVYTQRRGERRYRFRASGDPRRPGRISKIPDALRWTWQQLESLAALSDQERRLSVSTLDLRAEALPLHLPHRAAATILMTYPDPSAADALEEQMRATIGRPGPRWEMERLSDRPPMRAPRKGAALPKEFARAAKQWEIPFKTSSSVWPSVAGLVPDPVPVLCGVGPVARDMGTPQESVHRTGLIQRTLLMAQVLLDTGGEGER